MIAKNQWTSATERSLAVGPEDELIIDLAHDTSGEHTVTVGIPEHMLIKRCIVFYDYENETSLKAHARIIGFNRCIKAREEGYLACFAT